MSDWCILRTASRSTLRLAESLAEEGYEAWTPIETVKPNAPAQGQRPRREKVDPDGLVTRAMLPSFVFAKADRERDLLTLSRSPSMTYLIWDRDKRRMVVRGHPFFRLFHDAEGVAKVPDRALAPLRNIAQRRRKPRGVMPTWAVGDRVKLTEGCFGGLSGEVVELMGKKGKEVRVVFPGWPQAATFSAWALVSDLTGEDG